VTRASPAIVPYDPARHGDGPWRVVKAVFDEYGFPFDENDYDADLARPHEHYRPGWFWVAETADGQVTGCIGLSDEGSGTLELHRLYVLASARRGGLGERLCRTVIDAARTAGARELVLYSDIAFRDAHRLYQRLGFHNHRFRYAPDPWQSREWGFTMNMAVGWGQAISRKP
jgi:GNAT superfamily N-acetyltransferase